MKLKVCGLSNPGEVEACVYNAVDYCGFILNYPKSHRFVSLDKAKVLTKINRVNSKFVGVLVEPNKQELDIFSRLNLDYFQLYGNYSNDELAKIKKEYNIKIISTIQVKKKDDIDKYKKIEDSSDIILWDSSGYEKSLSWDYNWIKLAVSKVKKMIAGNITIDNLNDLIHLADIVDVSGALETNKVKDIIKIKNFTAEVKKINHAN